MAVAIERVELGRNPVQTGEQFQISVTIVTHGFLSHFKHRELEVYTHGQLKARGSTE